MSLLKDYLLKAETFLREKNIDKPRLEAQILFSHVLKMPRVNLYTSDQMPLEENEVTKLRELLVEKGKGRPTAYIIQNKEFFSLDFRVTEEVLIPRPETEELVEWVIENHREAPKVIDLCSGSGCIGVALASRISISELVFVDISEGALQISKENLQAHQAENSNKFRFIQSDLLNAFDESDFDLIVSNPPYIPRVEYEQLDVSVKNFEPRLALLVEEPVALFERLALQACKALKSGGYLYLETNPSLLNLTGKSLEKAGFINIETKHDLSGKERFVRGLKHD